MFIDLKERNAEILAAEGQPDPRRPGNRETGSAAAWDRRACCGSSPPSARPSTTAVRKDRLIAVQPRAQRRTGLRPTPESEGVDPESRRRWQQTGERPSPVMVWAPEQAGAFLDYAEAHDLVLYPLFILMLDRGLRRGEAVGLRDFDVELDAGAPHRRPADRLRRLQAGHQTGQERRRGTEHAARPVTPSPSSANT